MTALAKVAPRALASLWLTLAALSAAALIAASTEITDVPVGVYIAAPFAVLCLNLGAALYVRPALRAKGALLAFHLALALLAALVGADRLTSFSGRVEITEGSAFDPALVQAEAGPLHPWRLDIVRFEQGPFTIDYAPGMNRRETRSLVRVEAEDGSWREVTIGDDQPLTVGGYRLYTSFNKGFAPVVTFVDSEGVAHSGAIHLPSYPLNHDRQGNAWVPPGSTTPVKIWLHLEAPVYQEGESWTFAKPEAATLVVLNGSQRFELKQGEQITLGAGQLRFDELRTWMGYTISYNPIVPWMLGAIVIAVLCLGAHLFRKFRRSSWLMAGEREACDGR